MTQIALVPARAAFTADGTPWSEAFGDVYHSAAGGLEQARHVFLGGNDLPARWAARERFVVLETGFGLGLNFLATWQAWRADAARPRRLHYVSIERHPFSLEDLRALHERFPGLASEAAELHALWPVLVPGGHRLVMQGGAVMLTLFFADIRIARELRLAADAIYLDGFAPARNPEMWSPQTLRAISRLAAPGATAATWSVAAEVRRALEVTGFAVEKRPGFGAKREMLVAAYRGPSRENASHPGDRTAPVIGAGLAGAAVCERLCARGWEVTLLERRAGPALEASGNHAGTYHPIATPDDSLFARITRAGFLQALASWQRLAALRWDPCGALQLARSDKEAQSQQASIANLALPAGYAQYVDAGEASAHAGVPVAGGGLWFPRGGWVRPTSLVDALLAACGDRLRRAYGADIRSLAEVGRPVVLATAGDALFPVPHARLRRVRGQITYVPQDNLDPPRVAVLRGGLVLPPVDGVCVVGASFDIDDEDPRPRPESDAGNLERLRRILPASKVPGPGAFRSRVGFRTVTRDRLPVVGKIAEGVYGALAFGSRGLVWSTLAAELLASDLEGEPLPVEASLAEALSPARFARRAAKHH